MSQNENKPISAEPVSGVLRRSDTRLSTADAPVHVPTAASPLGEVANEADAKDPQNGGNADRSGSR